MIICTTCGGRDVKQAILKSFPIFKVTFKSRNVCFQETDSNMTGGKKQRHVPPGHSTYFLINLVSVEGSNSS